MGGYEPTADACSMLSTDSIYAHVMSMFNMLSTGPLKIGGVSVSNYVVYLKSFKCLKI